MLELRDLALASPGFRIVLSSPRKPDFVFGGDGVGIGGDSSFVGKDFGNAGGWYCVTGQSDRLQIVVNLGQITVVRVLVDTVFVEAPCDRRRRLSVVSRDPSFSTASIGKRLCYCHLSRGGLPAISLPGPPSARFFGVDGFPWTIVTCFGEQGK